MTRFLCALVAATWFGVAAVAAQAPAAVPATPPAVAPTPDNMPSPPADFTYSQDGRRDPFMTQARTGGAQLPDRPGARPAGIAGILVDELSVRGIVLSNGAYVAMISGADGKQAYSVRPGARLLDGTVQSITPRAVVILQQVSDPLLPQKQREVRKLLRTQEEGK